jgi:hypothetical protein
MTFGSTFGRVFSPTFQPKSQAAASAAAFVPTDISGCALWLDFSDANYLYKDAGSTKVSSDGDVIYQINDKSGNSRNAVRTSASNATAYKTDIKNGLSVGRYGTNYDIHSTNFALAQPFTLIIVAYPTAGNNSADYYSNYSGAHTWLIRAAGTSNFGFYAGASLNVTTLSLVNNWSIHTTYTNSTSSAIYVNGVSKATGNIGSGDLYNNRINSASGYRGDIAEMIVYDTALSDTDRGTVETYLNNKWAIY